MDGVEDGVDDGVGEAVTVAVAVGVAVGGRGKPVDRPTGQMVARAVDQAGIRPSNRQRRVGDYELGKLLHDGPGFQDFVGTHQTLPEARQPPPAPGTFISSSTPISPPIPHPSR